MDRLIQMILRRLMGHLVNRGIDHIASRAKSPDQMTPQDRSVAQNAKAVARRARQAANLARRMMR
jgi:hypothetical protein